MLPRTCGGSAGSPGIAGFQPAVSRRPIIVHAGKMPAFPGWLGQKLHSSVERELPP